MDDINEYINIDDFAKVDLRVGLIKSAEKMDGSDKLIKCEVDFGELGQRTIISGIAKYKDPHDMVGNKYLYVINLKPRKIFGELSEGMLVALHNEDDTFSMLIPEKEIKQGTKAG